MYFICGGIGVCTLAGPIVECMKMLLDLLEPKVIMKMIQNKADSCAEHIKHAEKEIQGEDSLFGRRSTTL